MAREDGCFAGREIDRGAYSSGHALITACSSKSSTVGTCLLALQPSCNTGDTGCNADGSQGCVCEGDHQTCQSDVCQVGLGCRALPSAAPGVWPCCQAMSYIVLSPFVHFLPGPPQPLYPAWSTSGANANTISLVSGGAAVRFSMGDADNHIISYGATATTFLSGGSSGAKVNFAALGCSGNQDADGCVATLTAADGTALDPPAIQVTFKKPSSCNVSCPNQREATINPFSFRTSGYSLAANTVYKLTLQCTTAATDDASCAFGWGFTITPQVAYT